MFFQGSITTTSPSTTPLRGLLANLEYYQKRWKSQRSKDFHDAVLLLLLTPAYARHALDPQSPMQTLRCMSGDFKLERPLRVVTAVVDAVPGTRLGEEAREGLVYLYQQFMEDEHEFSTHSISETNQIDEWRANTKSKPTSGELNFLFEGLGTAYVDEALMPDPATNQRGYAVTLPLAQTLFTTGRETTMQLAQYTPTSEADHDLKFQGLEELKSADISLPFTLSKYADSAGHQISMNFRMTPLTPARMVKDCLGNVIKSISSSHSWGKGRYRDSELSPEQRENAIQPASQELEEAIAAHFAKQNIPPAPVDVYALVMPYSGTDFAIRDKTLRFKIARMVLAFSRETTKGFAASTVDQAIRDLIVLGNARLCKVLSGGGGWGDKKGLLSLDPDSYGPIEDQRGSNIKRFGPKSKEPDDSVDEGASLGLSDFKPVVKSGENIMFFLAEPNMPRNPTPSVDAHGQIHSMSNIIYKASQLRTDDHAVFGVTSSSLDTMPSLAPTSEESSQPDQLNENFGSTNKITHNPHLFGAFSASPLTLTTSTPESLVHHKKYKPSRDFQHSPTKLGVVGLSMQIEYRMYRTPRDDTLWRHRSSREEGAWYAEVDDGPMQKAYLAQLREQRESAYQVERETMDEMQGSPTLDKLFEWQRSQTEDAGRVEDLFQRMSDSSAPETPSDAQQNGTNLRGQGGWGLSATKKLVGSAAKQALSALKRNNGCARQYSQKAKTNPNGE